MPAHLLYGDSFLVSQALKELQAQVGPPELLEANSHRLAGLQLELAQLRAVCDAVPFLAPHRLVMVEGLLSRLDSREGRRRGPAPSWRDPSSGPGRGSATGWDDLPRYIQEEMPATTILVLLEANLSRRTPSLTRLRPVALVQELPTPSGEGLSRWIRNRMAEKEAQITPGAIRLLSQSVGGNLWTLDSELEKLALYAVGRPVEESDVTLLVSQSREASIFAAVDALLEGRTAATLRLMQRLREDGAEFSYIVAMISRQLRLCTLAKDIIDRGRGEAEVRDSLGIVHDFALRRTLQQARNHSWQALHQLYAKLMEADLAVKRGRLDEDVALDLLVGQASSLRRR